MARTVRNAKIDTRSARAKLKPRREPYWTVVAQGRAVGYRRGIKGGSWVARYRDPAGRQHYRALGGADDALDADGDMILSYAQAQERARLWFERAGREEVRRDGDPHDEDGAGARHGPYTVGDACRDYLTWYAKHKKALRDTRYAIEAHILPPLGDIPLERLTRQRIERWRDGLAEAPARLRTRSGERQRYREPSSDAEAERARKSTANRVLTVLKAALNRARDGNLVERDDAWRLVKPFRDADAARVRYHDETQCIRLLNACAPDFRRMVRGALVSGARYGELCQLEISDFNVDVGALQARRTKGGRPRHIPLDAEAVEFFKAITAGRPRDERIFLRADGKPWGKSHQARPLETACKAAGIEPPTSFHILRHTWASQRIMRGMPLMAVAQVLGHRDTRMVERHYGHLAPSWVRDAVRATALDFGPHGESVTPLRPAEVA